MRILAVLFIATTLSAQQPPYDQLVPVAPPYHRVRYAASGQPGELSYPVTYTAWLPPGVATLRGVIVHQHGCGEGSCKSGQTGAHDLHWQALARKHSCALLSPTYEQPEKADCQLWCDPRNGSDTAFQSALRDLGQQSAHPEMAALPWALWGHSGGGHWCGGMALLHPERTVAAWLRSGVPPVVPTPGKAAPYGLSDAALTVPLMCNPGTKEGVTDKKGRFAGVWPSNETFFTTLRSNGALIGVAIDPLTAHECGNQRYLAIRWLDACLTARLPAKAGDALQAMPVSDAFLAPLEPGTKEVIAPVPAKDYAADPSTALWLPNQAIAEAWTHYVKDTAIPDATPPPAPTNVQVKGQDIIWDCAADLDSGIAEFIIERDGEFLAKVQGKNPFGRPLFQGLQYSDTPAQPLNAMRYTDTQADPAKAHRYRVIAVNTVGLKSE
jgi:hypothetical protein